jgi:hypothetical protein
VTPKCQCQAAEAVEMAELVPSDSQTVDHIEAACDYAIN